MPHALFSSCALSFLVRLTIFFSQNRERAEEVLRSLDTFLTGLLAGLDEDTLFILTSDHGNIEDLGTRGHTFNNVPLVALGPEADQILAGSTSLMDVMPRVLRVICPEGVK
mgnify:CR=1 FL=1